MGNCCFGVYPSIYRVSSKANAVESASLVKEEEEKEHSKFPANPEGVEDFLRDSASNPMIAFSFNEVKEVTENFRQDYLLGGGGFGSVYKGFIREELREGLQSLQVAVKVHDGDNSVQGHREWLAEVIFLGQLSHPNLVKLIGYSCEDNHRVLIYEFMARGSVEANLFSRVLLPLPWDIRMKIAYGAAKGLTFLHEAKKPVIYRDFKTSNILLDQTTMPPMDMSKPQSEKEREKSYIHWTVAMDNTLSRTLLEQQNLGRKGANGWKAVAFTAAITALWDECQTHISKEKIMARLRTRNKYYQEISAMLDTSGFGWDWDKHVVKCDSEDVWANYIKHYKDKVIIYWGDPATLCGTNRATGSNAATGVESAKKIEVEELSDDEDDAAVESAIGPSKRRKTTTKYATDLIAAAVTRITNHLEDHIEPPQVVHKTRIERMYESLALMSELSEYDIIKAIDLLSTNEVKCEVFLVLPELIRRSWLRVQLGD